MDEQNQAEASAENPGWASAASPCSRRRTCSTSGKERYGIDGDVAERSHGRVTWHSEDGGRRETVATGLPLGMPQAGLRLGRRSALLAEAGGSVLVGCDGDGGIRRLRRG